MAFAELITIFLVLLIVYICILISIMELKDKKPKQRLVLKKWTEILTKEPCIILINWELTCERLSSLVTRYTKSAQLVVYAEGHRITCKRRQAKFYRYEL